MMQGQKVAQSKEYFPSSIYGKASPRVVAAGEPVPRGGGTYMIGKPYSVAGQTYYPSAKRYVRVGLASWYGDAFHGRRTANGEVYDSAAISAAHPTMPLPSYARVTNLSNHHSMIVRVNDRGPFSSNRIMDVSRKTAEALQFKHSGTARVKVEYLCAADLDGSDDRKLMATLRLNGPAAFDGAGGRSLSLVAENEPMRTAALDPARDDALALARESASSKEAGSPAAPVPAPVNRIFASAAPLPPARPFDLGISSRSGARVAMRTRQANLR